MHDTVSYFKFDPINHYESICLHLEHSFYTYVYPPNYTSIVVQDPCDLIIYAEYRYSYKCIDSHELPALQVITLTQHLWETV